MFKKIFLVLLYTSILVSPCLAIPQGFHVIGDTTNNIKFGADSDLLYVGAAGVPYGSLYLHEGAQNIDISAVGQGSYVKVTGLTAGLMNDVSESSDAFNVGTVGTYKISWQLSGDSAGVNKDYEVSIFLNSAEQSDGSSRVIFGDTGVLSFMSGTAILAITDTSHDVDLRIKEVGGSSGTDLDLAHVNFSIVMIGGTIAKGFEYGENPPNIYVFGGDYSNQYPYGINTGTGKVAYSVNAGSTFVDLMNYPGTEAGEDIHSMLVLNEKLYVLTSKLRLFRSSGLTVEDTFTDISCPMTEGLRHSFALGGPYLLSELIGNYLFIGEYSTAAGGEFTPEGPRILRYDTVNNTWVKSTEIINARHIHAFYVSGTSIFASVGDANYSALGVYVLEADDIGAGAGGTDAWAKWTSNENTNYAVNIIVGSGNFAPQGIYGAADVVGAHIFYSELSGTVGEFAFTELVSAPSGHPSGETCRSIVEDTSNGNLFYFTAETAEPALYLTFPPYNETVKLKDLTNNPPVFTGRSFKSGQYIMNYDKRFRVPS